MMKQFLHLLIVLLATSLATSSCGSIKPGGGASGTKTLYRVFYTAGNSNLYFIKPLELSSDEAVFETDFSFKYSNNLDSMVTMNFSIVSDRIIQTQSPVSLSNNLSTEIQTTTPQLIFKDRRKSDFVTRYSCQFVASELNELMNSSEWTIEVKEDTGSSHQFVPTKKTKKKIESLNQDLFVLF